MSMIMSRDTSELKKWQHERKSIERGDRLLAVVLLAWQFVHFLRRKTKHRSHRQSVRRRKKHTGAAYLYSKSSIVRNRGF